MKIKFNREQRITNALMINAYSIDDIGLLHGKMGVVLYFFHLGRAEENELFTSFAEELLDYVVESLDANVPINFEKGVTGIGWAVEYLIQHGFVDADADDILDEIDRKVSDILINKDNHIDIIISIGYYYISRIIYRIENKDNLVVLNLKYNMMLLIDELEQQVANGVIHPQMHHLLSEFKILNISNFKVDKLLNIIKEDTTVYLFPFIPKLKSDEIDAVINAKDIKSRHAGFELNEINEAEKWGIKNGVAGIGVQKIFAHPN